MGRILRNEPFQVSLSGAFAGDSQDGENSSANWSFSAGFGSFDIFGNFVPTLEISAGGPTSRRVGFDSNGNEIRERGVSAGVSGRSSFNPAPNQAFLFSPGGNSGSGTYRIWVDVERWFQPRDVHDATNDASDVSEISYYLPNDPSNANQDSVVRPVYEEGYSPRIGGSWGVEISINGVEGKWEVPITSRSQSIPLRPYVSWGGGADATTPGGTGRCNGAATYVANEGVVPYPIAPQADAGHGTAETGSVSVSGVSAPNYNTGFISPYYSASSWSVAQAIGIQGSVSGQALTMEGQSWGSLPDADPLTVELPGLLDSNGNVLKIDCDASGAFNLPINLGGASAFNICSNVENTDYKSAVTNRGVNYAVPSQIGCRLTTECAERIGADARRWTFASDDFPGAQFTHETEKIQWATPWTIAAPQATAKYKDIKKIQSNTLPPNGFIYGPDGNVSVISVSGEAFPSALRFNMGDWLGAAQYDTNSPSFLFNAEKPYQANSGPDFLGYRFFEVRLRNNGTAAKQIALTAQGITLPTLEAVYSGGPLQTKYKAPIWTFQVPGDGAWHTYPMEVYRPDFALTPTVLGVPALSIPHWLVSRISKNAQIDLLYIKGIQKSEANVSVIVDYEKSEIRGEVDALPMNLPLGLIVGSGDDKGVSGWNITDLSPPAPDKPANIDFNDTTDTNYYPIRFYLDSDLWKNYLAKLARGMALDKPTPATLPAAAAFEEKRGFAAYGGSVNLHFTWVGRAQIAAAVLGEDSDAPAMKIVTKRTDTGATGGEGVPNAAGWATTKSPFLRPGAGYDYKAKLVQTSDDDIKNIVGVHPKHRKRYYARFFAPYKKWLSGCPSAAGRLARGFISGGFLSLGFATSITAASWSELVTTQAARRPCLRYNPINGRLWITFESGAGIAAIWTETEGRTFGVMVTINESGKFPTFCFSPHGMQHHFWRTDAGGVQGKILTGQGTQIYPDAGAVLTVAASGVAEDALTAWCEPATGRIFLEYHNDAGVIITKVSADGGKTYQ